jgi:hypothetical protein
MQSNKAENESRNQQHMRHEEARDGERPHIVAATHRCLNPGTNEGHFARNICSDRGGEIGFLVLRQQIADERSRTMAWTDEFVLCVDPLH